MTYKSVIMYNCVSNMMHQWEELHMEHVRMTEIYSKDPKCHPLYHEEWLKFVSNRSTSITSLGASFMQYDYTAAFMDHWQQRLPVLMAAELEQKVLSYKSRMTQKYGDDASKLQTFFDPFCHWSLNSITSENSKSNEMELHKPSEEYSCRKFIENLLSGKHKWGLASRIPLENLDIFDSVGCTEEQKTLSLNDEKNASPILNSSKPPNGTISKVTNSIGVSLAVENVGKMSEVIDLCKVDQSSSSSDTTKEEVKLMSCKEINNMKLSNTVLSHEFKNEYLKLAEKILLMHKHQKKSHSPSSHQNESYSRADRCNSPHPSQNQSPSPHPVQNQSRSPHQSRNRSRSSHQSRNRSRSPHQAQNRSRSSHRSRNRSRSPRRFRNCNRSPRRSRHRSRSPRRSRHRSRSPRRSRHRSRSPHRSRHRSRSPHRSCNRSRSSRRSPHRSRNRSRSPQFRRNKSCFPSKSPSPNRNQKQDQCLKRDQSRNHSCSSDQHQSLTPVHCQTKYKIGNTFISRDQSELSNLVESNETLSHDKTRRKSCRSPKCTSKKRHSSKKSRRSRSTSMSSADQFGSESNNYKIERSKLEMVEEPSLTVAPQLKLTMNEGINEMNHKATISAMKSVDQHVTNDLGSNFFAEAAQTSTPTVLHSSEYRPDSICHSRAGVIETSILQGLNCPSRVESTEGDSSLPSHPNTALKSSTSVHDYKPISWVYPIQRNCSDPREESIEVESCMEISTSSLTSLNIDPSVVHSEPSNEIVDVCPAKCLASNEIELNASTLTNYLNGDETEQTSLFCLEKKENDFYENLNQNPSSKMRTIVSAKESRGHKENPCDEILMLSWLDTLATDSELYDMLNEKNLSAPGVLDTNSSSVGEPASNDESAGLHRKVILQTPSSQCVLQQHSLVEVAIQPNKKSTTSNTSSMLGSSETPLVHSREVRDRSIADSEKRHSKIDASDECADFLSEISYNNRNARQSEPGEINSKSEETAESSTSEDSSRADSIYVRNVVSDFVEQAETVSKYNLGGILKPLEDWISGAKRLLAENGSLSALKSLFDLESISLLRSVESSLWEKLCGATGRTSEKQLVFECFQHSLSKFVFAYKKLKSNNNVQQKRLREDKENEHGSRSASQNCTEAINPDPFVKRVEEVVTIKQEYQDDDCQFIAAIRKPRTFDNRTFVQRVIRRHASVHHNVCPEDRHIDQNVLEILHAIDFAKLLPGVMKNACSDEKYEQIVHDSFVYTGLMVPPTDILKSVTAELRAFKGT
ncbi:uncharacterized protein LOC108678404 [Hyalella azteca]|uniref:Uncharacterized protein LOC108678404 n=1 Tax=Hyalella azteca TaxID=294128 RepID=A0A8B7P8C8_HYAAZ|nr:uncharacterized protein LOC108678404 [Hyalella azteca]